MKVSEHKSDVTNSTISNGRKLRFGVVLCLFVLLLNCSNDKPEPQKGIVFAGSSSIAEWKDLKNTFQECDLVNTGVSGALISYIIDNVDDVVTNYSPEMVFIYIGENDIARKVKPQDVMDSVKLLYDLIIKSDSSVQIVFISLKPSPSRWYLKNSFIEFNQALQDFSVSHDNFHVINTWDAMLGEDEQPNKDMFREDLLHLNENGYAVWASAVSPYLKDCG